MTSSGRKASKGRPAGDQFLAALSHELRTPLNGVLGMAGLLARTRLAADQRSYVTALQESGEHLLSLVNDVLDLARLEATGFELHAAPTDVELLLQSTAELLSPRAHAKGLQIAWAADPGLPSILADEGRIRQILFNLAGNAVKFTEAGGVLITARRIPSADGVALRFSVLDTGPGVAAADRERIFEPFAQGPASTLGQIESTGLGLAIVRRLAAAFKGEIGLDSEPGHGADFWFEACFPAGAAGRADDALAGRTVVVVTADPIVGEAAVRQIEACGGEAMLYATAAKARAAPAGAPALYDYGSGRGRRLRPLPGRPSIVLLEPEQRARIPALRRAGFQGYLIKPLRRGSLAVRVLAVSGDAAEIQALPPVEDERATPAAALGVRVLLAEDNPINAMLGRALLEREGCAVDRVQTGRQAVEAALTGVYDLILLDLRMPELGGIEAAVEIRRAGMTPPIAALPADAFADSQRDCLAAGMDGFLTKPLDPIALRSLVVRLTGPSFAEAAFTDAAPGAKLAS